jgi:hypothetical protein
MRRVLLRPAPGDTPAASLCGRTGAPMGFRFASAGMVGPQRMDGFRCTFMRLTLSPAALPLRRQSWE